MESPKLPGHVPHLSPGMTTVITAGEKYTMTDDNGKELELEGRDRPWVLEFLSSMDNFLEAGSRLGDDNAHTLRFASEMRNKWLTMPEDLKRTLPSSRGTGVRL